MAADINPYKVAPGQIWRDADPRENRTIKINEVRGGYAFAQTVIFAPNKRGVSMKSGRTTRIRLDRFKPTTSGYRRVS